MLRCKHFFIPLLNVFLVFGLLLFGAEQAQATHALGSDLTYACTGNPNEYRVTLNVYRDCNGINLPSTQRVSWRGSCGTGSVTASRIIRRDITPICPSQNSSCGGGNGNFGVEQHTYEAIITVPSNCTDITFSWSLCCRNNAITTLTGNPAMYVETRLLNHQIVPCNNSPIFLNPPAAFTCRNNQVFYNHGAIDPDQDSLRFSLIPCMQSQGNNVSYRGGFSGTQPFGTGNPTTIDPATGAITFTPTQLHVAVLCVLVEEYRNGVLIGTTMRDIQFRVLNCNNVNPVVSGIDSAGITTTNYTISACFGRQICFDVIGSDPGNPGDNLFMNWDGGIPGATFTVSPPGVPSGNQLTGTFCWTPTISDIGTHRFTVTIQDDACPLVGSNTFTYVINIQSNPNDPIDAGPDQQICIGSSANLSATTTAPNVVRYIWTPTTGLSNPNIANPVASPTVTTNYVVTAVYADSCTSTDQVRIVVDDEPLLSVSPNNINVCGGAPLVMSASTNRPNLIFDFVELPSNTNIYSGPGAANGPTATVPVTVPNAPGAYQWLVTVTDPVTGCSSSEIVTWTVGPPIGAPACRNIYASTTGVASASGSQFNPVTLQEALRRAACNNSVIKIATGTYNIDTALNITSNLTVEGGFIEGQAWLKTSEVGATTINRTTNNAGGVLNLNRHLTAIEVFGSSNFRLQDLTISTDDAVVTSTSTYGIFMNNPSNYNLTRLNIEPGAASNGTNGTAGCDGTDGDPGDSGLDGLANTALASNRGGRGGNAGNFGNLFCDTVGTTIVAGGDPATDNAGVIQPAGVGGTNPNAGAPDGSGGGGGGLGGAAIAGTDGAASGNPGAPQSPPFGCSATPTGRRGTSAAGGIAGTLSNSPDGTINNGTNPTAGDNGTDGLNGCPGSNGSAGTFAACRYQVGAQAATGMYGSGGAGGGGGGGSGGQSCPTCNDGTGAGGGGGGGGAGTGGRGGFGGGGSFGVYLCSNGANGFIEHCFIDAGTPGAGGIGGAGGVGGQGGAGGAGGAGDLPDIRAGAAGGAGGDGGDGGQGGNGQAGIAINIFWDGNGTVPVAQDSTYELFNQQVIFVENTNCTNAEVMFWDSSRMANDPRTTALPQVIPVGLSGTTVTNWVFDAIGLNTIPPTRGFNADTTRYNAIGRYSIIHNTCFGCPASGGAAGNALSEYRGFHNIAFDRAFKPDITSSANVIGQDTFQLCVGDFATFASSIYGDTTRWDFDGAIPNPGNVQFVPSTQFNTPGFYEIKLFLITDCCGDTPTDTAYLYVDPVPTPTGSGDETICFGDTATLSVAGLTATDSIVWSPNTNINIVNQTTVEVFPSTTTIYTASVYSVVTDGGQTRLTCPVAVNFNVTVNDLPTPTMSSTAVVCNDDGTATATPAAGSYNFVWSNGFTENGVASSTASSLAAGTYCVTVTNTVTGCVDEDCIFVAPAAVVPTVFANNIVPISCFGANDGSVTIGTNNGTAPFTYQWDTLVPGIVTTTSSNYTVNNLAPRDYTVTSTDNNGCISVITFNIPTPDLLTISIIDTTHPICQTDTGRIEVEGQGGTGVYNYAWSNGQNGPSGILTGIDTGFYCVTVTDQNSCEAIFCINLDAQQVITTAAVVSDSIDCNGGTACIAVNAAGGGGTYSYSWTGAGITPFTTNLDTACNFPAGVYTVVVTDDTFNCSTTQTITVTEPSLLTSSITAQTNVNCFGDATGSATVVGNGGTPGYSFLWDATAASQTTATATNLAAGIYSVSVTDINNCLSVSTVTLTQPSAAIDVTASITSDFNGADISCFDASDGEATAVGAGGTPAASGYVYNWNNGQNTAVASNLSFVNNPYSVTITDSLGCQDSVTILITQPTRVTASISSSVSVSCFGDSTGTATAAGSGGTGSTYTFQWNDGQTTQTAINLAAINNPYLVVVTDSNGCQDSIPFTVQQPGSALTSSASVVENVNCFGGSDAVITAIGSGGTAPISFQWDAAAGNATTATVTGLPIGVYCVTVSDANNCSNTHCVTVTQPPVVVATIDAFTNASCNGGTDGTATVSGSGGNAGTSYTFLWDANAASQTTATATNLGAGIYSVTVSDDSSCIGVTSVTITEPNQLVVTASITSNYNGAQVSCPTASDGSVTAVGQDGTAPYTFAWSNGGVGATQTGLDTGLYIVTITDVNNCTALDSVTIVPPAPVVLTIDASSNVSCRGDSTGTATVSASGGSSATYSYIWNDGTVGPVNSSLPAGNHCVTATDINNCPAVVCVPISQPDAVVSATIVLDSSITCNGFSNGGVHVQAVGGTPFRVAQPNGTGYTYLWNNTPASVDTFATGLSVGAYTVTVTDSLNCTTTASITLTEPSAVTATAVATQNVACFGDSTGQALAIGAGGTPTGTAPNYTFQWSNGQTTATATGLPANTPQQVTVTDANGCVATASVSVSQPSNPVAATATINTNYNGQDVSCNGATDGEISVTGTGGTPNTIGDPYTYIWTTTSTNDTLTVGAGTYSVTITDSLGCSDSATIVVTEPNPITLNITNQTNVNCFGASSGAATVAATGGTTTTGYNYIWDNGTTTAVNTNLPAGIECVTVTDANSCVAVICATITQPSAPVTVSSAVVNSNVTCNGSNEGSITVAGIGGTPFTTGTGYTYNWSANANGQTTATVTNLTAGTYCVTITDSLGCSVDTCILITEPTAVDADVNVFTNISCFGGNDGTATASAVGGTVAGAYSFQWSAAAGGATTASVTGLSANIQYCVTVTDDNGCTDTACIILTQPTTAVAVSASQVSPVSCAGANDGVAAALGTGGTGTISYQWDAAAGNATTDTVTGLPAGTYCVTATDVNGCLARACVTITEPTPIAISVTSTTDVVCRGDSTGEITISATGGTGTYSFLWGANANNRTTASIAGLAAGTYCVTVTDAAGCQDSICVTLTQPNSAVSVIANVISNYNGSQIRCFGDSSGVAVALATGGTVTTDYQYRWSITTQTSDTAVGLPDGLFCVTATDDFGCTDTACVVISEPTPVVATITATTNVTCLGDCSGTATVAASGGIGTNYTFLWDAAAGSQTTATATNLCAGLYGVTVTDQNGCIGVTTVTITEPNTAVQASAVVASNYNGQDVSCNNAFDGSATASATGGTGSYTYQWNGAASGQTTATATGLGANINYCVTVTDSLGCIDSTCIVLTEPTAVLPTIDTTIDVTCFGDSTGSATVSATGGVAPYRYQWDAATGGQTTATAINLPAGSYTVTVTDNNGCIGAAVVVVRQPSGALDVTASVTSSYPGGTALQCFGDSSGTALATISGGSAPYTQQWNHGPTTLAVGNLAEGTYCLTVTDSLGCTDTACVTLVAPTPVTISLVTSTDASCIGGNDGQATVVAGGGIAGYTYQWDAAAASQTTATATNLAAGTYGVTATDANGCQIGTSVTIGEPATSVVASVAQTIDISCAGETDGQLVASAVGGTTATVGQYSYTWTTGAITDTLNNVGAGTYCVSVSDDNGCTDVVCITVTEPAQLLANLTNTDDVACAGDSTGSATVAATGGTAPYSYLWSANAGSQTTATANNLPAGSYTVTITDANDCTAQTIAVIDEPIAPLAVGITTTTMVQCFGDSSGAVQANITGGTAPYTINWNQGATTAAVSGLAAGTYCVTITDANNCTAAACVTLAEPTAITSTITTTPADCQGAATGTATVMGAGGTGPYNYQWDAAAANQTTATATGLLAGVYGVTVTDANGCSFGTSATVTEPSSSVVATINQTIDVSCAGATDGQLAASAVGGTTATAGQYSYTWTGGNLTDTLNNIGAGTYCVTVSDDNGCTDVACITVTEPAPVVASIVTVTNVACAGDNTGSATVAGSGGTAPYSFLWSANAGSQNTATATNLAAGSYTVTITDANGCIGQTTAVISQPAAALALGTSTTPILCAGDSSGTAQVTITGGTAPYTINWNHGPTTANVTGLPDGTYCVTVRDANGCTATACVTLVDPAAVTVNITATPADCRGAATGTATAMGAGGTAPYTYQWDANASSQTTATATGLAASASPYQVTVTDANGCTTTGFATVGEPATNVNVALVTLSNYNGADVSCNGATDAVVGTSVTGGSAPYTYLWSNGTSNDTLMGVGAGQQCVTVTDANGCASIDCITITEPSAVTATAVVTNATCFGACDGTATVTGNGGTAISAYTVQWDAAAANQTTATAINLCAGSYNVTITDNNGCTAVTTVLIGQPSNALAATITATSNYNGQQISCTGASDGELTVAVTGGTAGYTFAWNSSPSTTNVATGLAVAGNPHCVTVTDVNGCSVVECFNLVDPAPLTAVIDTQTNVSCNGGANGTATVLPNGGTGAYTYQWDANAGSQTTARATGLAAGPYCVTVTDANNCQVVVCVNITEPTVLTTIATVASNYNGVNVSCAGGNDGVVFATPSGGTLPYSYAWSVAGAGINDTITNAPAGVTSVLVTDANGCTATASVTLTEPSAVTATITASTDATCNGQCDGTAVVTGTGGTVTTGYTFLWSNTATTDTVTGLCAGTYSVTVTDNNGCTNVTSVVIGQPLLGVSATATVSSNYNGADVSCFGSCDGEATATGAGGTVTTGYTFLWSNGQTTPVATGLCGDSTYTVTVSDNGGCSNVAVVTLDNPDSVVASISSTVDVSCGGGSDGQATVTATGGTTTVSGYTYQWDSTANNQTTATATNLPGGVGISVTVTDNNGCSDVVTVTITQPSNLLLVTPTVVSDYNGQDISCNGECDAAVAVQISGGVPGYNFTWSTGASTDTITNLCAGTYAITVTDNAGCTVVDSVTVVEPAPISASIVTQNNVSCTGGADACVEVQGAGGTPGYTYAIQSGVTQANNGLFCNLPAGTYVVTVTDLNFCATTVGVTITEPANLPTVSAVVSSNYNGQDVSCFGACDASLTATPTGGTAPYTYSWSSTAQTTPTVTGLCAGTYSVLITDSLGCTASAVVTVTEPTQLTGSLDATTNVPCFGDSTGTATFTVAGGTAPYTYAVGNSSVTTASTTATVTGIGAGGNTATVTDANGCNITIPFIISSPPLLTATATVTSSYANGTVISCNGACDGAATAVGAGGNPGSTYNFLWSDPAAQNTFTATGLCAGTYTVSITDQNGCTAVDTVTLIEPAAITATSTQVNVSCFGDSTGSILIAATPGTGTPNYTYSLGTETNATGFFTNLGAGTYCITITDANNCTAVECITITQTPAIQTTTQVTSNYNGAGTSCFTAADGSVMVNVTGGQAGYTYQWSTNPVQTTAMATNLPGGTYYVTVTDTLGCIAVDSVILTPADSLVLDVIDTVHVACFGQPTGSFTVAASGGVGPYLYSFDGGATFTNTVQYTNLPANMVGNGYCVIVRDANGCETTTCIRINEPNQLQGLADSLIMVSCFGGADGLIAVSGVGGNPPYRYSFNGGSFDTTRIFTGLAAGNYTIRVQDSLGCIFTMTNQIITEPAVLVLNVDTLRNPTCTGNCDGVIQLSATGGTTAYDFSIDGVNYQVSGVFSGLCAGGYTVYVRDAQGCITSQSVILTQPAPLDPNAAVTSFYPASPASIQFNVSCNGSCDGSAIATPSGGTATTPGTYTYAWSVGGATTRAVTGLCAGITYTVTVTDQNGCTAVDSVILTEPTELQGVYTQVTNETCAGDDDGVIAVTAIAGTGVGPYSYDIGSGPSNNGVFTNLAGSITGTPYSITITDANGCTAVLDTVILEPNSVVITGGGATTDYNGFNVSCFGATDGAATVTFTGGTAPVTYLWSVNTGAQTTAIATNLGVGTYCVTLTDANGCTADTCVTITGPTPVTLTTTVVDAGCNGTNDGSITANATGGTGTYSYSIDGVNYVSNNVFTGLSAGTYTIYARDSNDCGPVQQIVTVDQGAPIVINTNVLTPFNGQAVACAGDQTATAVVTASGGSGGFNFSYQWDANANNQTTATATNLGAGTFLVTVTDNNSGCTAVDSVVVIEPTPVVVVQDTVIDVNCGNGATGAVQVVASGGTPGYTYDISAPGQAPNTTGIFINLSAGTYTVSATDVNGCMNTVNVTIGSTTPIVITLDADNVTCSGSEDGQVVATVSGGIPATVGFGYTFNWNGPNGNIAARDTVSNVGPGRYFVTVQDSVGCTDTASITVLEPQPIVVTAVATPATCGNNDGSIVLTATGGPSDLNGTPNNYEYSIDGGATFVSSNTFNNLSSGFYDIVVRDAGVTYCIGLYNVDLGSNSNITGSVTSTNPACDNLNSGSATVFATSPAGGYTYRWFTDLNTVTLGTSATLSNIVGNVRDVDGDGILDTTFHYIVVVTDANGCEYRDSAYIVVPERPTIGVNVGAGFVQNVDCYGGSNGVIQMGVEGDTTGFTYFWSTGATTSYITGLSTMGADSLAYYVTVTDATGCVASDSGVVYQPDSAVTASYTGSTVSCANQATGTITLNSISGGTAPYLFSFGANGPYGSSAILTQGLRAGVYTVYTQDLNGCIDSVENIIVRDTIDYQVTAYQDQTINLGDTVRLYGTVNSTLTGADSALVSWSQLDPNTGIRSTVLVGPDALTGFTPPVFYTDMQFILSLNNGCGDSSIVTIEVNKQQTIFVPDAFSPNGDGTNDIFTVYGSTDVSRIKTFMVFDRWGEMVHIGEDFEPNSIDPANGWDGTFRGQAMNPAVFVYYAEIELANGETVIRKGDVTLIR